MSYTDFILHDMRIPTSPVLKEVLIVLFFFNNSHTKTLSFHFVIDEGSFQFSVIP